MHVFWGCVSGCLSSWQEEVTPWAGLNHIVDAVAGGRRGRVQRNVSLVVFKEEQRLRVEFCPVQSIVG